MRTTKLIWPVASGLLILAGGAQAADEWRQALPGEPLYEAKQRIESAERSAAQDPLEKSAVHTRQAERRLAEIQSLAAQGKLEHIDELGREYESALDGASNEIERARKEGRDVSHALQTVESVTRKHTEVLTGLLDKVPEQAVPGIQRAIEASKRGRETATQRLRDVQAEAAGRGSRGMGSERQGTAGKADDRGAPGEFGRPGSDQRGFDRDTGAPSFDHDRSRDSGGGRPDDSQGGHPGGGPPGR